MSIKSIKSFFNYLWYVLKHKYYVFIECCKLGIPLRGILHDMSKFRPSEWIPYQKYFYGGKKHIDSSKHTKPATSGDLKFDLSWLSHIHKNKHHHQYWVLTETYGSIKVFEMPMKYRKEMLADWKGAGKAQGKGNNTQEWYLNNRDRMVLGKETRAWIEKQLNII